MMQAGRINIITNVRVPALLGGKRRVREVPLLLSADQRDEAYRHTVRSTVQDYLIIALAAKLAMSDGLMNASEIHAFRKLFHLPGLDDKKIEPLLIEASHDRVRADHYARRLVAMFPGNAAVYRELVGNLFRLALVDGAINSSEIIYLHRISTLFGLPMEFFLSQLEPAMLPAESNPYELLGVKKNTPDDQLKKAYYRAVQACHPDKLSFLDQPEEIIRMANRRLTIISEAYSAIKRKRHASAKS